MSLTGLMLVFILSEARRSTDMNLKDEEGHVGVTFKNLHEFLERISLSAILHHPASMDREW